MFQVKIEKKFKDLPKVFGITDDILIVDDNTEDRDHNKMLKCVMHICSQENLKANKNKCNFRCTRILLFRKIIPRYGVQQTQGNCVS